VYSNYSSPLRHCVSSTIWRHRLWW